MSRNKVIHTLMKYQEMKDTERLLRRQTTRVENLKAELSIQEEILFEELKDDFPWNLKLEKEGE